jgi:transcriptional regulator with XRE-family HTH domain
MDIQNNLKHYRLLAHLTQEQVVEQLGLKSNNRLSRWEAGKAYPSVANLLLLAELYKVSSADLYKLV